MQKFKPIHSKEYSLSIGIALKAILLPLAIIGLFGSIESIKTETPKLFQARNLQIEANQKAFNRVEDGADSR